MSMEIMELSEEDMESAAGGGRSWDHEAIREFLQNVYDQQIEAQEDKSEGDTVVVGLSLADIAEEWYDGSKEDLDELDYTNPNVNRTIREDLPEAGFSQESQLEDRKYAVGNETKSSGTVVFKIELTPA